MVLRATISFVGIGLACCAWAQPLPVKGELGAASAAPEAQRSAIWMAVHAQHSEASSAQAARRLTPSQRMELREQIRRAAADEFSDAQDTDHRLARPQLLPAGE